MIKNILIRNTSFISFKILHRGVKDSYSFLLCSLKSASKAFLSDGTEYDKTDFPYHEVKSESELYLKNGTVLM